VHTERNDVRLLRLEDASGENPADEPGNHEWGQRRALIQQSISRHIAIVMLPRTSVNKLSGAPEKRIRSKFGRE
jgi:hypothetical protein